MSEKSTFFLFILLFSLPFISSSQSGLGTLKSAPSFVVQLNGVEAAGTIHRTDTILTVIKSDGTPCDVLSTEIASPRGSLITPGGSFSKDMREFLSVSKKGQRLFFLLKVRDQDGALYSVSHVFILD